MKPGRELDALIAEKVMGWTWDEKSAWSPSGSKWSRKVPGKVILDEWGWLLHYSTDICAAWEVVEKMSQIGFKFVISNSVIGGLESSEKPWCFFGKQGERVIDIVGHTIPHAICLAALKAVGCVK